MRIYTKYDDRGQDSVVWGKVTGLTMGRLRCTMQRCASLTSYVAFPHL